MTLDLQTQRDQRALEALTPARLEQATVALSHAEPWAYAEVGRRLVGPAFVWHEPGREAWVALGCAATCPAPHPGGHQAWCSEIAEQASGPSPGSARLMFVGGFGFRDGCSERGPAGPWAGWGPGALWLPRVMIRRVAGGCEAVVTAPASELAEWTERVRALEVSRRPIDPPPPRVGHHTVNTCGEREDWTARVSALVDAMVSPGAPLRKVVLARAQQLEAAPGYRFDALSTAWHLRDQQAGCAIFAWCADDGAAFVGATPELLCRVDGGGLQTSALAGTAPRGRVPAEDEALARALAETAKERHEHRLVVDGIVESLAGLGAEVTVSETPEIRQLQDVQHLETPIAATLPKGLGLLDAVGALHPTPAVGGVPREAALRWLAEHEGLDRGHYAAPIGWMNEAGDGAFFVALRSVLLTPDCAWAFAGAGIVAGSDPSAEWREVNHKLRAVRGALTTCREVGT